jgi:hypothetical protein
MRRIFVRLDRDQAEALVKLAEAERRHPSDQAAILVIKGLQPQQSAAAVKT